MEHSRTGDKIVRILLIIAALAIFFVSLIGLDNTRDWHPTVRSLVFGSMLAIALVSGIVGSDIFGKGELFRITPKRRGKPLKDAAPPMSARPVDPGEMEPVRLAGNVKWWAGVLAITATAAVWLFIAGRSAFAGQGSDPIAGEALVASALAVLAGVLAIRALVGLATARGALVVERDQLRLGASLGYWPPLRLNRAAVRGVADTGALVLLTDDRIYETANVLFAAKHPAADIVTAWPELGSGDGELGEEEVAATLTGSASPLPEPARAIAERILNRRRARNLGVFLIGAVGLLAIVGWYLVQRADNDRLLEEGIAVVATVVDTKDGNLLFPGLAEVDFSIGDDDYTGVVAAGPFHEYRREIVGTGLGIVVDPDDPERLRAPDERNINPAVWSLGAAAAITTIFGFGFFKIAGRSITMLREVPFRYVRIRIKRPKALHRHLEVAASFAADGGRQEAGWLPAGQVRGARGLDESERDGWLGHWKGGSVVVVEEPPRVLSGAGLAIADEAEAACDTDDAAQDGDDAGE